MHVVCRRVTFDRRDRFWGLTAIYASDNHVASTTATQNQKMLSVCGS